MGKFNQLIIFGFILTSNFLFSTVKAKETKEFEIYVSPFGDDLQKGDKLNPLKTIVKAQQYIRSLNLNNYSKITVYLRKGVFRINSALLFSAEDSGTKSCLIEYKAFPNEDVVISGAINLVPNWQRLKGSANIWKLKIDKSITSVNQLFANGKRLSRSASPTRYTNGALKHYDKFFDSLGRYNFKAIEKLKRHDLLPFCSFTYDGFDLEGISDLDNVELLIYHSWDASWHQIASINKLNKSIFLKSPSVYPVGFFPGRNRYKIENSKEFLRNIGDWCYDPKTNELLYFSQLGKSPNQLKFEIPILDQLLLVKGNSKTNAQVQYLKFSSLKFQYTSSPRGINIENKLITAKTKLPWLDVNTGFSGYQTAVECGQAIWLQYAKNISFEQCTFSRFGTYALKIDHYSSNNQIKNCEFYDLGGGGVILGYNARNARAQGFLEAASPSENLVYGCKIYDGGIIFPSAVGIAIMNAINSSIVNNEVYNFGYSGISSGWTWGFDPSYTYGNKIEYNKIHDVLKLLADGGGIYTLGRQPNTTIVGNVIYNIFKVPGAIGADNNGIFFDEGSSDMYVAENVIYNIGNQKIRYNQTDSTKIKWKNRLNK
ncbi:MAG: right-handed parallel beta-helix repeat-containing protein [Flavobacterium sp.]|nr:MAG: right-handed parallel beta-helix repeat-containing protein [Flavobacterium sp.]